MRPVRGTKGVVYIQIAQLGKGLGEFWIIGLLTWLETNIFK